MPAGESGPRLGTERFWVKPLHGGLDQLGCCGLLQLE